LRETLSRNRARYNEARLMLAERAVPSKRRTGMALGVVGDCFLRSSPNNAKL